MGAGTHAALSAHASALLTPLIAGRERAICIVDAPHQGNVGDHAILLGELAFLRRAFPAARLSYVGVTDGDSSAMRAVAEASLLVMCGGGNFGDVWLAHHRLRMHVLERYPSIPKVQMPQSLRFRDARALEATARAIARQSDFTLLARDRDSLAFAEEHFACATALCPDAAFLLPSLARAAPSCDVLALLRDDRERAAPHDEILATLRRRGLSVERTDWSAAPRTLRSSLDWRIAGARRRLPALRRLADPLALWARERYAEERLAHGIEVLSRGRRVVTDRLHGHIIAAMLGIDSVAFDSLGGKVGAFHRTWFGGAPGLTLASSPAELDALT